MTEQEIQEAAEKSINRQYNNKTKCSDCKSSEMKWDWVVRSLNIIGVCLKCFKSIERRIIKR